MRIAVGVPLLILIAFSLHLALLYRNLDAAFHSQQPFIPTRVYSDVWKLTPATPRSSVEARLKRLGYSPTPLKDGALSGATASVITLHDREFPEYLIPENHPTRAASGKRIVLRYDRDHPQALLQSISIEDQEIPELYLEPELIATLGPSGDEPSPRIKRILPFEQIPSSIWQAIIAVEDQHFLEHRGFDPRGLARAILVNLRTFSLAQGGSTLTQQLVKNLMERHTKNIFLKVNELFLSIILEFNYSKEQILERYLNEVYLGQVGALEIHGIAEGAQYFFAKKVDELHLGEIAMMAGLIRGPGFYSPYRYWSRATERQKLVLKRMVDTGQISQAEANEAMQMPIRLAPPQTAQSRAPFFADYVKSELLRLLKDRMPTEEILSTGIRVYTTLDLDHYMAAQKALNQELETLEKKLKIPAGNRLEGAVAVLDHSTSSLRVLIGGRSYAQSTFNRILNMKRQVGSTFKPFVTLTALSQVTREGQRPYSLNYPVQDAPYKLIYDQGRQTWEPRNYEKKFMGWTTLETALSHSINTVAAKLGQEVGIDAVVKTAQDAGMTSPLPAVPSLALGVAELSPLELLTAYGTIANHGVRDRATTIRAISQGDGKMIARYEYEPKTWLDPAASDQVALMLQSVMTEGTARDAHRLGWDRPSAGKTGTTSNYRDAWFAGFTPQLTTVVWVGFDLDPAPGTTVPKLTGANSALPIWVRVMNSVLEGSPPEVFTESPLLEPKTLDVHTGFEALPSCPTDQVKSTSVPKDRFPTQRSCEREYPKQGQ